MNILHTGFMNLAQEYKRLFYESDTDAYFKMVSDNQAILGCFIEMYGVMVKQKRIVRIEDLSSNEKSSLWGEAKRIAGDQCSKEHAIRLSKALHFLGTLIQE